MVKVDFTIYPSLYSCPVWWKNFVASVPTSSPGWNALFESILAESGCLAIDNPGVDGDLVCLVFESQESYDSFRTYWLLKG